MTATTDENPTDHSNTPVHNSSVDAKKESGQTSKLSESERSSLMLVYILQAAGFLTGISFIAAVIVNYVKRPDLVSEIAKDHCNYQIRTFWWSAGWCILSAILAIVLVGYLTMFIAVIWTAYRIIRGLTRLNDGRPATGK